MKRFNTLKSHSHTKLEVYGSLNDIAYVKYL